MKTAVIKNIDELIEKSTEIKSGEEEFYFKSICKIISDYFGLESDGELSMKTLFEREISSSIQNFTAYCFLRILNRNVDSFEYNTDFKHKVYALFDRNLNTVYAVLGLAEKNKTYEKKSKLSDYVSQKEKVLSSNLNFLQQIDTITKYENSFYKTIRSKENSSLLNHFAELDSSQQKFERVFSAIKRYNESDVVHKYELYNQALNALKSISREYNDIGTYYSVQYFERLFMQMSVALEKDFLNDPASKPADLEVVVTEKKHPFNLKGTKNKFELRIVNKSLGSAFDSTILIRDFSKADIDIAGKKQFIGTINQPFVNIEFGYEVLKQTSSILIDGEISWTNFDGKENNEGFVLEIQGQSTVQNWNKLEQLSPYDLEPVDKEQELIGRDNILNQLKARIRNKLGSSYLYGQRRVGKTSIVKTLQTIEKNTENLLIVYIEAGDWNDATGSLKSMDNLGRKMCSKIKRFNRKFENLTIPDFNGSLNQISDFLDDSIDIDKNFSAVFILDEFDRVSSDLLKRSEVGQSFMLTLRSISNRSQFGFVLVGGEKLEYILSQWQEFNKFKPVRVDYFDKQNDWEDFKKLIKEPVSGLLEFNDKAIDYIYNQTSGNPYFTKLICIELFRYMVNNRDTHVTEKEANKATEIARNSSNIAATDFSHFWEDGIKEKIEKEEEVSINRRKLLITLSELIRRGIETTKEHILNKATEKGLLEETAIKVLEEFEQRKIIFEENGIYKFIVKFFEDWLVTQGIEKIITTFEEEERIKLRKKREDDLKVTSKEVLRLTDSWKSYRGKEITSEKVNSWLSQFEDVYRQRLMYKILSNVKFYNESMIREKMEVLYIEVQRLLKKKNIDRVIEDKKLKRSDILVSYMDKGPSKSGAEYTKKFAEVNNIYVDNAIEPTKILEKLNDHVRVIVFIDDMIGTGQSLMENIENLLPSLKERLIQNQIVVFVGFITGFQSASTSIEEKLAQQGIDITVKILDPLASSDKSFDENSKIFANVNERNEAKNICLEIGSKLEKTHPLGYGGCEARIVFPSTCPNNTLPILWKKTKDWTPIFER